MILLALVSALALAAASSDRVIRGDYLLGDYRVKADGSLGGAIDAFGPPSRARRGAQFREICYVRWQTPGLSITFYNLGGLNPCTRVGGRFSRATVTGRAWQTGFGLRVGDSVVRLRSLHPRATRHGEWWWLVTRGTPFGYRGVYPGLAAKVTRGRVVAFAINYQAGGE